MPQSPYINIIKIYISSTKKIQYEAKEIWVSVYEYGSSLIPHCGNPATEEGSEECLWDPS